MKRLVPIGHALFTCGGFDLLLNQRIILSSTRLYRHSCALLPSVPTFSTTYAPSTIKSPRLSLQLLYSAWAPCPYDYLNSWELRHFLHLPGKNIFFILRSPRCPPSRCPDPENYTTVRLVRLTDTYLGITALL